MNMVHYVETVHILQFSSQEFLVLNWSTCEGWKAELTLGPHSGFEHRTLIWKSSPLTTRPLLHTFQKFPIVLFLERNSQNKSRAQAITHTNQEKGGLDRQWKAYPKVKLHGLISPVQNSTKLVQNSF